MAKKIHHPKDPYNCFSGQKINEKALLYIRKHWIIDAWIIFKGAFWIILPFIFFFIMSAYNDGLNENVFGKLFFLIIHLYALFVLLWFFIAWMDVHLDLIIVTEERIVDINQIRIFNRKIAETNLTQVQDVSGHVKGILSYFFNYGYLKILTASSENNVFEMNYVYKVPLVASRILEIRDEYIQREKRSNNIGQNIAEPNVDKNMPIDDNLKPGY